MRDITLIYGMTGSGKTFEAKKRILNYNKKRVIIIDSLLEYGENDKYTNKPDSINGIYFYSFNDLSEFMKENYDKEFICICRFTTDSEIEGIFLLCEYLQNLLLVVEEIESYISPYAKRGNILRLVNYGRHWNISILGIARRCAEISTQLRSQVNHIISFKQNFPNDLQIMESLGFPPGLDKLEKYKYVEITP
jgi:hypothetical protein